MKKILTLLFIIQSTFLIGCDTFNAPTGEIINQKGMVKGVVKNGDGSAIANAKVVIENTIYLASYVYATTNAKGEYSATVPNGSWKASVQIERDFLGKTYKFDLHSDNANPFAGSDGAVRNFIWKLSGAKPNGGFYGSQVAVYPDIISGLSEQDIEIKLVPQGALINGSVGATITKKLIDVGGGEYGVNDVPIGKYTITAKNTAINQSLQLRLRNTGNFANTLTTVFSSGFTGNTTYQIVVEVK